MSEHFGIYHKIKIEEKSDYALGLKEKFLGLNNTWLFGINTLILLNQYLDFQKANSSNKIISNEKISRFEEDKYRQILQNLFSMDNKSYRFFNTSFIENLDCVENKERLVTKRTSKEYTEHGFYEENNNGYLFLSSQKLIHPEITFFVQEVEMLKMKRLYSYTRMCPQEYRTFFMIKHLENMNEVFEMYVSSNKRNKKTSFDDRYNEFVVVLKDSLSSLKEELNFLKETNILKEINMKSIEYKESDFNKDLPFFKTEREKIIKKEPYNEKTKVFENCNCLNDVFKEQLKQELKIFNQTVDNYQTVEKSELSRLLKLKEGYKKYIKLIDEFIDENRYLSPNRQREIKEFVSELSL